MLPAAKIKVRSATAAGRMSTCRGPHDPGQIHAGVAVRTGETLRPGDLLFTRGGMPTHDLGHVVIYAGGGTVQAVRRILATAA